MRTVVVINGKPRTGKDTVVDFLSQILQKNGYRTRDLSSIDPIRHMLREWGFPVDLKGPKERALLADVGTAVEKYNNYRTQAVADQAKLFFLGVNNGFFFIHMREPENIRRLHSIVEQEGISFKTLLIRSKRAVDAPSNAVDAGVEDMEYDWTLDNNGTLAELAAACLDFATSHGLIMEDHRNERRRQAAD